MVQAAVLQDDVTAQSRAGAKAWPRPDDDEPDHPAHEGEADERTRNKRGAKARLPRVATAHAAPKPVGALHPGPPPWTYPGCP